MNPSALFRIASPLAALALLAAGSALAAPEVGTVSEEQARAGFLFQLAQYVQWPAEVFPTPNSPLRVCVVGQDSLASTLESTVRGKKIQDRSLVVLRAADPGQALSCHVVFLSIAQPKNLASTLGRWTYPPALLVGEASRFAELGGMVNLALKDGRVSFEINLAAVDRAHLQLRSQLLRFARIVTERREVPR